jgi:hypothetical protein
MNSDKNCLICGKPWKITKRMSLTTFEEGPTQVTEYDCNKCDVGINHYELVKPKKRKKSK